MASFQDIYTRGQQTDGVWAYFAPTLAFGTLALAPHQADVAAMPGADQAVVDAEAAIDETRDLRDVKLALVRELATRLPRLAANSLAPEDSLQDDIRKIQGIEMESDELVIDRGQSTRTLWTGVNARLAAATPPVAALTVLKAGGGTWAVADLAAALTAIPALEQDVKDAAAPLSEKRSLRRTLATRVDRANKRWYEAWGAHFPEGTPEHEALSQITTEGGGSGDGGSGGGGGATPPAAPVDAAFTQGTAGDAVEANATVPAGITLVRVYQRGVGDPNPPVLVASAVVLPTPFTIAPGEYEFTMTFENADGESAPSAVVTLTVA